MNRMNRLVKLLILTVAISLLTGCASVFNSGPENISINSTPNGARVSIFDEYGELVASGRTQFKVALKAGKNFKRKSYRVKVEKLGYEPHEFIIYNKVSGWYWGNVLYGGPLGAVIDPITGNMWKLDPAEVDVKLEKVQIPGLETEKDSTTLLILTPEDLTPAQRTRLAQKR